METNELYHYGVKGMKWGVRKKRDSNNAHARFQKGLSDLKKAGRENDIDAVVKLSRKYDKDRKAEKQKAKTDTFGMKDVRTARKAVKEAFKSGKRDNYERVSKEQGKALNKVGYYDQKKADAAFAKARVAIKEAMLLDAGYTKARARKGAEWFESHNWNITFTDNSRLFDYVDDID